MQENWGWGIFFSQNEKEGEITFEVEDQYKGGANWGGEAEPQKKQDNWENSSENIWKNQ